MQQGESVLDGPLGFLGPEWYLSERKPAFGSSSRDYSYIKAFTDDGIPLKVDFEFTKYVTPYMELHRGDDRDEVISATLFTRSKFTASFIRGTSSRMLEEIEKTSS